MNTLKTALKPFKLVLPALICAAWVTGCATARRPAPPTPAGSSSSRQTAPAPAAEESIPELLRKAHTAFRQQYFNEAVLRYREVERSYQGHAERAADRIADCYLFLGDQKRAIEAYRRALKKYRSRHAGDMLEKINREGI